MSEYIYFTDPMHTALAEASMGAKFNNETAIGANNKRSKIRKTRRAYDKSIPKVYVRYVISAEKREINFDLTVDAFLEIIDKDCNYCGKEKSGGVDRVDSKAGYIESNSVPCCTKCNMMKHTLDVEMFKSHINKIYEHQNK